MNENSKWKVIALHEFFRLYKARKQLACILIIPVISIIGLLFVLNIAEQTENENIIVYVDEEQKETAELVINQFMQTGVEIQLNESSEFREEMCKEETSIPIIRIRSEVIDVYYDSAHGSSSLINKTKELARRISVSADSIADYQYIELSKQVETQDLSTDVQKYGKKIHPVITSVLMIALMLLSLNLVNQASDTIPGERERGSFDLLKLTGISSTELCVGKGLMMVCLSLVTAFMIQVTIWGWLLVEAFLNKSDVDLYIIKNMIQMNSVISVFLSVTATSLMISSMYFYTVTWFDSVKAATSYCSIVMVVVSLCSSLSEFVNFKFVECIPLIGITKVLEQIVLGQVNMENCILQAIIAAMCFVGLMSLSGKNLKRI